MSNGPFPAVGLYWYDNVDPTLVPGMAAPLNQILIRTDLPSIYYKSGLGDLDWTPIGEGSGSGTTITDEITIQGDGSLALPVAILAVQTDATLSGTGAVGNPLHANTPPPANLVTLTNSNAGAVVIGAPVYSISSGHIDKAEANAAATAIVAGLVADVTIAHNASGNVQTDGPLTATTGQWDVVTGGAGGLTFGVWYYLDPATAGKLTAVAPSTNGQLVAPIGNALSTTILNINIQKPVQL